MAKKFSVSYLDRALDNLDAVIEQAKRDLDGVEFDTLVGTGFSGGIVIPALALAMGKRFVLIRKESDDSHHGPGLLVGSLGERWVFVDDFVSTGRTRNRVIEKIETACEPREAVFSWEPPVPGHTTTHVGDYYYVRLDYNGPDGEARPGFTANFQIERHGL